MNLPLACVQKSLKALDIQGYIIPSGDEFLGEYVPDCARRLEWLTGFTGSTGMAIVLTHKAAFFTDGRYTLQAAKEVKALERFNLAECTPEQWLAQHGAKAVIGYDARLHTMGAIKRWKRNVPGCEFRAVDNPIDALWTDRPAAPATELRAHSETFSGISSINKRKFVGAILREKNAQHAVLVLSDSVNWLLNIRAGDLEYTPVALAYALLSADGSVRIYIDSTRVNAAVLKHMGVKVQLRAPEKLATDLRSLKGQRVLLDPQNTPVWFADLLEKAGAELIEGADPCQMPKAIKNSVELDCIRSAHVRDGLALTRFLHWLSESRNRKGLDELSVDNQLQQFRRLDKGYEGPSFSTIAGFAGNGAIVHYRATAKSHAPIGKKGLLLLDSGGQYAQGTTDVTRTIAIGLPTAAQKKHFTLVLKGHIALATALFPPGTAGGQLDVLARRPLWQEGLDYDHGTGHGVGMFLSVHEGPQRISKKGADVPLQPGMILSNEPGYYQAGAYGIRIENLVAVVKHKTGMLAFETLTLAPIDRALIDVTLLSAEEKRWLNVYHARVLKAHAPHLDKSAHAWLKQVCAPIGGGK